MLKLTAIDLKNIPSADKIDTLVVPVCEDRNIHDDETVAALIESAGKREAFKGDSSEEMILYSPDGLTVKRVMLLGLGKAEKITAEKYRQFSGKAVRKCIEKDYGNIYFAVPSHAADDSFSQSVLTPLLEGAYLGNHQFNQYKKEIKHPSLKKISFILKKEDVAQYKKLPEKIETVCEGTIVAREWVSIPSNDKRPEALAKNIAGKAEKAGLKVTVLDEKELKKKKFNAMLAVAQGSKSKPRLVIMEHNPSGAEKTIAFVGKGVTFDSGGINLKPSGSLDTMKMDMAGCAAVSAALIAISKLNPDVRVIGAVPLVENMPSGDACRPGDIYKSYSGKTVEIGNTDAEGRLILIDTLAYINEHYKPDTLIDLATLTGACVMALGEKIAGVFSPDDELAGAIISSGKKTHERCWRLPMPEDYKEFMKSEFADISNMSSSKWGGAITAALFLSEFVGETKWAHIDIAGPAYAKKGNAYCQAGGTGFGVRLICDFIENL